MHKVAILLTEEQLNTVLTALKMERSRLEENKSERAQEALPLVENALSAILKQPWNYD